MDTIKIGFPISLSGKYTIQGSESLQGIKLWHFDVNSDSGMFVGSLNRKIPVDIVYYDDESLDEKCKEVTLKLLSEDKVDLFLGPYSSGLAVALAPISKKLNRVVWNYGGATDEITEKGYKNFVNAITPSSHYYYGLIEHFSAKISKEAPVVALVYASDSGFSLRVKNGARQRGIKHNFEIIEFGYKSGKEDFTDIVGELASFKPDLILGVGRMQDDINFARSIIESRPSLTENIAVLAASIDHFGDVFGNDADGFYSTSQWEKGIGIQPDFGPTPIEFHKHFMDTYKKRTWLFSGTSL